MTRNHDESSPSDKGIVQATCGRCEISDSSPRIYCSSAFPCEKWSRAAAQRCTARAYDEIGIRKRVLKTFLRAFSDSFNSNKRTTPREIDSKVKPVVIRRFAILRHDRKAAERLFIALTYPLREMILCLTFRSNRFAIESS